MRKDERLQQRMPSIDSRLVHWEKTFCLNMIVNEVPTAPAAFSCARWRLLRPALR